MVAKSIIGLYGNKVGVQQTINPDEQKSSFGKAKSMRHSSTDNMKSDKD